MRTWPNIGEVRVRLDFGTDGVLEVGTLASAHRTTYFEYDRDFLRGSINPSPFHLAFEPGPQIVSGEKGDLNKMFADALPDGWSKGLIDARVREAGYDPRTLSQLDRLALVGGNGVGALSFAPVRDLPTGVLPVTIDDLAATVMRTGREGDAGVEAAQKLAGSLGGARPKAAIWLKDEIVHLRPVEGATPWLVKFPNPAYDLPDDGVVEYAFSRMARAAGIQMMETLLLPSREGPGFFATARFDRVDGRRYHYQSFAGLHDLGLLDPSGYQELLDTDLRLSGGPERLEQQIRRMAFNVLASNRDDHVRNHGFLMNVEGRWVPSPAFDLTFSPGNRHMLMVGNNAHTPGFGDIGETAAAAGMDRGQAVRIARGVRNVIREWPRFAREAGLDVTRTRAIQVKLAASWKAAAEYDKLVHPSAGKVRSFAKGPAAQRDDSVMLG